MATLTVNAPETIPQDVKCDLIALAILQRRFLELGFAFRRRRAEIEVKMPGASRLVSNTGFIGALIEEYNGTVRS